MNSDLLIHSFSKYLLSTYYVSGTQYTTAKKQTKILPFVQLIIFKGEKYR